MRPIEKKELKKLIEDAEKEGKDASELKKILRGEIPLAKPKMGEKKVQEIEKDVWSQTLGGGAKKVKKKGKRVIISTGPAREEDFE
jgi:hypothetical protein